MSELEGDENFCGATDEKRRGWLVMGFEDDVMVDHVLVLRRGKFVDDDRRALEIELEMIRALGRGNVSRISLAEDYMPKMWGLVRLVKNELCIESEQDHASTEVDQAQRGKEVYDGK